MKPTLVVRHIPGVLHEFGYRWATERIQVLPVLKIILKRCNNVRLTYEKPNHDSKVMRKVRAEKCKEKVKFDGALEQMIKMAGILN